MVAMVQPFSIIRANPNMMENMDMDIEWKFLIRRVLSCFMRCIYYAQLSRMPLEYKITNVSSVQSIYTSRV